MNLEAIIAGALDVAQKLAPLLAAEASPVGQIIALGESVVEHVQAIRSTVNDTHSSAAELDAALDNLAPKVQDHLSRTIDSLG